MQGEIIHERGASVQLIPPASYESDTTRRYPLLFVLEPDLQAQEWTRKLLGEGVLPEIMVATLTTRGDTPSPVAWIHRLTRELRLLDSPGARWIIGTAHSAVTAMNAVLDDPELFGKAACLSTSFEGNEGAPPLHSPVLRSLEDRRALPGTGRLYFDYGSTGLDECYEPYHRDLGGILRGKGWREGREFQVVRTREGSHDPASWIARLGTALRWLAAS